jgi:hypothetical protein
MPPHPIISLITTVVPLATTITGAAVGATVAEWLLAAVAPIGGAVLAPASGAWVWSAYLTTEAASGAMIGAALGYIGGQILAAQMDPSR